jgi:hypothetical protein
VVMEWVLWASSLMATHCGELVVSDGSLMIQGTAHLILAGISH